MALLQAAAIGAGIVGNIIGGRKQEKAAKKQAAALEAEGRAVKASKYFTATQLESAAKQQQAVGQLNAAEELRKSELLQSRALAIAGASGGSATDPDILRITSQFAKEGQMAAAMQMYEGDEAARGMALDAVLQRWEGDQAEKGANINSQSVRGSIGGIRLNTLVSTLGSAAAWAGSSTGKDTIAAIKKWGK